MLRSSLSWTYGFKLVFSDPSSAHAAAEDIQRLLADPFTRTRLVGEPSGDEAPVAAESVGRMLVLRTMPEGPSAR